MKSCFGILMLSSVFIAVDAEIIAGGAVGFPGWELEYLVNHATLKAAVDGKEMVPMMELEFSKDEILLGGCSLSFVFLSYTVHHVREQILLLSKSL